MCTDFAFLMRNIDIENGGNKKVFAQVQFIIYTTYE